MAPEVNISFASLHVGLTEVPVTTELPALWSPSGCHSLLSQSWPVIGNGQQYNP